MVNLCMLHRYVGSCCLVMIWWESMSAFFKSAAAENGGATNYNIPIGRRQLRYRGIALSGFGFGGREKKYSNQDESCVIFLLGIFLIYLPFELPTTCHSFGLVVSLFPRRVILLPTNTFNIYISPRSFEQ